MERGELWRHSSKFMKSEKKIFKDFVNDESDKELEKTDKEGIEKEGAKATMNVAADAAKDVKENVAMKTAAVAAAKKDCKEVGTVEKVLVKEENAQKVGKETKNKVVKDAIVVAKLALERQ